MPIDPLVARSLGAALWDARPTQTDRRARALAQALGYPRGWRVVRTIESTDTHPVIIVDKIFAGKPGTDCDCWFHHAAAQKAAALDAIAAQGENQHNSNGSSSTHPQNRHKGGHLLPRQSLYNKGDKLQAFFEDQWWDCKIVRKKEHATGFRYQVHYTADNSKQSGVPEDLIRPRPEQSMAGKGRQEEDPQALAVKLGFPEGWKAVSKGSNRYSITDAQGRVYTSKAKAMEALAGAASANSNTVRDDDQGDPPWRTAGHEWLGRRVERSQVVAVTSRRKVTVKQYGSVTGWIASTDVDKAGNPGYRSEKTGEPAALFRVVYDDDPNHPYPSHLMESQDLEEFEIEVMLLPAQDM